MVAVIAAALLARVVVTLALVALAVTAAVLARVVVAVALVAVVVVVAAMVALIVMFVVLLAGVLVSLVAVPVARVAEALAVSVVLVAVPMLVGMVIVRPLCVVAVIVVIVASRATGGAIRIGFLADPRLRSRGDPAAARALRGCERGAGRGNEGTGWADRSGTIGRRCGSGRTRRGRVIGAARRLRRLGWRRDGGADLAGSGGRGRKRRLLAGEVEKSRRCQDEADRSQYGEQADYGCGYARKATPHKLSHRRASA